MTGRSDTPRRVEVVPGGPVLVEGPVEVASPEADGGTAVSDRVVVAICTCRRSRRLPWCDTSHRRHSRPPAGRTGTGAPADPAAPASPGEPGGSGGSGGSGEHRKSG